MPHSQDICLCGYEGRQDNVQKHRKRCRGASKIESLLEEIETLKKKNENLESTIEHLKTSNVTINNPVINNNINNIQNNITVYGNEELPKALTEITQLCRKGEFAECVPRYIEMKHFPDGKGNIRFDSEGQVLEVFKDNRWVKVSKEYELSAITEKNSNEVVERYGEKPIVSFFRDWASNNLQNKESSEFQNVKQKVEDVILKNS
tara:strand:+ start:743 stop:1357 length:615 start_codon:yes stop_codon:yes gene_type:complete